MTKGKFGLLRVGAMCSALRRVRSPLLDIGTLNRYLSIKIKYSNMNNVHNRPIS